jgi:hypothetical protein
MFAVVRREGEALKSSAWSRIEDDILGLVMPFVVLAGQRYISPLGTQNKIVNLLLLQKRPSIAVCVLFSSSRALGNATICCLTRTIMALIFLFAISIMTVSLTEWTTPAQRSAP